MAKVALGLVLAVLTPALAGAQASGSPTKREQLEAALATALAESNDRSAGWTYQKLGWHAYVHSDLAEAARFWELGFDAMIRAGDVRGWLEIVLARTHVATGDAKDTLIRDGLAAARSYGEPWVEGALLQRQGEQESFDGRYADAVQSLTRAIALLEPIDRGDTVARALITTGRVYRMHGRHDRALQLFRRATALMERANQLGGMVQALTAVAVTERHLGNLAVALKEQRRAVALAQQVEGTQAYGLQRVQLAWIFIHLRRHRQALALLEEVIRDGDGLAVRLAYDPLSVAYLGLGDARRARTSATLAMQMAIEPAAIPSMLEVRARAAYRLGDADQALADVRDALERIEARRHRLVPNDSMKQGFGELHQALFSFAIRLLHERGADREALATAERARARAFLDLLASRDRSLEPRNETGDLESHRSAPPFSADDLIATANSLNSTVLSYWVMADRTLIWTISGNGSVNAAVSRIAQSRLQQLIAAVSQPAGTPDVMRTGNARSPTPEPQFAVLANPTPRSAWRDLHAALIAPIARYLPRRTGSLLTIEPHGPLFRLSFAGLLDSQDRYLLEKYTLHYVPAGGVLVYTSRVPAPNDARQYLLVADPRVQPASTTATLPPLPGAKRELTAIRQLLPKESVHVLTGVDASEAHVRGIVPGHAVLHFATHAVLRDDAPLQSFLAFDASRPNGADDGRLTVQEIYSWRIGADLVVLSACRTALGRITGDGVIGLIRAFFYAGAASVMATLWDVIDDPGVGVMQGFYARWRSSPEKAAALRSAQLELLGNLRAGRVTASVGGRLAVLPEDPRLWAGFVLVGAPR